MWQVTQETGVYYNVFLGDSAGYGNVGSYNVFLGKGTGKANSGTYNSFMGYQSGMKNTSGAYNVFLGYQAGYSNLTAGKNVFIGYQAGRSSTGSSNVMIGNESGKQVGTGRQNVFIGDQAGRNTGEVEQSTIIGYKAGTVTAGNENVYIGAASGFLSAGGVQNVAVGNFTLGEATSSQSYNTCIGYYAGYEYTVGNSNTLIGYLSGRSLSGSNNTCLGYNSGYNLTGSNNVFLGSNAGSAASVSERLYIDNTNTNTPLIWGDFENDLVRVYGYLSVGRANSTQFSIVCDGGLNPSYSMRVYKGAYVDGNGFVSGSDIRLKKDIEIITGAIDKVKLLRGVEYNWRSDEFPDRSLPLTRQVGLISQEVEAVLPGLVTEDEGGYKGIAYGRVSALLVEAIKEQQTLIETQQLENLSMRTELQSLKAEVEALKAMMMKENK